MCDIRLFKSAYQEYELAVVILNVPRNDEAFLNAVAYHLQQAVEKTLKAFLECTGVTVPNTHDIDKLIRMSKDNGSRVYITEWLEDKADTITRWETDTRYNLDYRVEADKINKGIKYIGEFFEVNGMKYEIRDELKDEATKQKLKEFFPKTYEPVDDFEWNCYYQIYRKKLADELRKEK